MRPALPAYAVAWLLAVPVAARATDVEVHVRTVSSTAGEVRALLFGRTNWLSDNPTYAATVPAQPGEVVLVVRNVAPGTYGVVGHHDADNDGDVTRNFLGLPVEGIGFSNGVRIGLRAPRFDEAAVNVSGARMVVTITLQFER